MPDLCPFCEKGALHASTRFEEVQHNGKALKVHGFHVSDCDACGEEMVRSDQAKLNQKLIADACLSSDEKLSTGDLKCFRLRHGLSQAAAAELFGGGANAFSKYERGEVMQSRSMDLLIRVYDRFPEVRSYLSTKTGGDAADVWVSSNIQSRRITQTRLRPTSLVVSGNDEAWEETAIEPMRARR